MILVLVPKTTSRITYIMQLMLKGLLGLEYKITNSTDDFISYAGHKFIYGKIKVDGSHLYFAAAELLFEKGIGNPVLNSIEHAGEKALFPVYDKSSALPYDPFAAAFFMVSRYEEYLPYRKDIYGRFTAYESLAHKMGFLQKAVVNRWSVQLGRVFSERFKGIQLKPPAYRFLPTYDIDQMWAFREKGFVRTTGAYLKNLLEGDFKQILGRTKVLFGFESDPFDTFDYQLSLQKKYNLQAIYFFLFARYGEYDKNIPTTNFRFRQMIKRMADYADAGIHPSYYSNTDFGALNREIRGLAKVLNREVKCSRQHYLKLHLPETYRNLAALDITRDYTMGFAALPGFRAGICIPFQFYDIDTETIMPVTVVPFSVMDGTLMQYMKLSPDAAIEEIRELINEVRTLGGTFSSLWHNDSLSETAPWVGWRRVYEELVKMAV